MRRIAVTLAVTMAAVAIVSAAPASASPEGVMLKKINEVRSAYGVKRMRPSYSLFVSSAVYARRMMRWDWFGHQSRILASNRFRAKGETLAMHGGWRLRPRATVRRWMRSPGHRAVLLSSRYTRVGVGRSRGRFHGRFATIWVAHVGRP